MLDQLDRSSSRDGERGKNSQGPPPRPRQPGSLRRRASSTVLLAGPLASLALPSVARLRGRVDIARSRCTRLSPTGSGSSSRHHRDRDSAADEGGPAGPATHHAGFRCSLRCAPGRVRPPYEGACFRQHRLTPVVAALRALTSTTDGLSRIGLLSRHGHARCPRIPRTCWIQVGGSISRSIHRREARVW